jgi:hypothetical protein
VPPGSQMFVYKFRIRTRLEDCSWFIFLFLFSITLFSWSKVRGFVGAVFGKNQDFKIFDGSNVGAFHGAGLKKSDIVFFDETNMPALPLSRQNCFDECPKTGDEWRR